MALRKCSFCKKDELVGVGKENIPVCEYHFEKYLSKKMEPVQAAIKKYTRDEMCHAKKW